MRWCALLLGVAVAACSRGSGGGGTRASAGADSGVGVGVGVGSGAGVNAGPDSVAVGAPGTVHLAPSDPAPPGEATRTRLDSLDKDPLLRPQLAKLRAHFGDAPAGPFEEQKSDLASGRTAVMVSRPDESDPIVLVLDRDSLLFAKERPVAGIAPPVLHPAIAPAPERGVAVFAYVASMHIVAARMWADDSNPYSDIDVFRPEACDALSVAYQAGVGWIIACSSPTGTRVQRLREDLTAAWTREGILVGNAGPVGRPKLGFESRTVWTLEQVAKAIGGDRKLTFRYGVDAKLL